MKTTGQGLISTVKKKKKTLLQPAHTYSTFHAADFPRFSQIHTACDSALSAATPSVRHICSDSHDGCETETPTLAHTQGYDKL